jgi:hypothetical protein
MLETRGAKPATVARRVASLATAHSLSGLQERGHAPTSHVMSALCSAALKRLRRRRGAAKRQATPLRFGATLDPHTKGFTLTALLGACGGDLQGLHDAALLSLGYEAGLHVSKLVAATVAHIDPHSDGSALLFIPSSRTDQEGQGAWGWLSPDTVRRVGAWLVASGITEDLFFRRVGVNRRRLRAAVPPMADEAIPGHPRHWQEKLRGKKAKPTRTVYIVASPHSLDRGQRDLSAGGAGAVEPFAARGAHAGFVRGRRGRDRDRTGLALVVAVNGAALWPQARCAQQRRRSRSLADQKLGMYTKQAAKPAVRAHSAKLD